MGFAKLIRCARSAELESKVFEDGGARIMPRELFSCFSIEDRQIDPIADESNHAARGRTSSSFVGKPSTKQALPSFEFVAKSHRVALIEPKTATAGH